MKKRSVKGYFDPEGTWLLRWPWVAFDEENRLCIARCVGNIKMQLTGELY